MSDVVAFTSLTLDGVMQAPGRPNEDGRGGFEHGGWATAYADPVMGAAAVERMGTTRGILLGRRTYEDFAGYWPHQTDNPFTPALNETQKYVASTTLREPLGWANSTLLGPDVPEAVRWLRSEPGGELVALGSGELVRSLMKHGLVDRFVLLIHPLVLGSGRRLFADDGEAYRLRLEDATTTTTGVVITTYRTERDD